MIQPSKDKSTVQETDPVQNLYDAASEDFDLGTYDEFQTKLQDSTKRRKFYDAIKETYDVGNFDNFNKKIDGHLKKKVPTDSTVSPSDSGQGPSTSDLGPPLATFAPFEAPVDGQAKTEGFDMIPEQLVNLPVAELYDQYKDAGVITDTQVKSIEDEIERQKEGDRSLWEKADALATGMLSTGMMIPLYRYDTKEDLMAQQAVKNRVDFLEALPEEKVKELNAYAVRTTGELSKQSRNTFAENAILEEKSRLLINNIKHVENTIRKIHQSGKPVPPEGVEHYQGMIRELQGIANAYNQNVDIIESNNEDIGDFYEELDFLKKNYGGLEYYKDIMRLSAADLIGGMSEFGSSTLKMSGQPGSIPTALQWEQFNKEFRAEVERQRGFIKPMMSVGDIEGARDLGKWLAEQSASQLPVIAVLAAGGSPVGLTALGTSAAGSKMGELRDEGDYSETEIFVAGLGVGAAEVLSERVSLGILSKGKRALSAINNPTLRQQMRTGVKDFIVDTSKDALSEAGSEFVNQIAQNSIDILYLGDQDVHVLDGTVDALASGGAMGAGMSAIPSLIGMGSKAFMKKETTDQVKADAQKASGLLAEAESKKDILDDASYNMLVDKAKKVLKENDKKLNKAYGDITNLDKSQIKELIDIDKEANKILSQSRTIQDSDMNPSIKQDLLNDLQTTAEGLRNKKNNLLNEASLKTKPIKDISGQDLTNLPDKGLKLKEEASKLIQKEFEDKGVENYKITDEQITEGAVKLLKKQIKDAKETDVVREKGEQAQEQGQRVGDLPKVDGTKAAPKEKVQEVKEPTKAKAKTTADKAVSFSFLGESLTGVQQSDGKIIGKDGTVYRTNQIKGLKEVETGSIGDLKKVDISRKVGLDKAQNILDDLDTQLDKFGKDTLGTNIPVVVAKGAVKAMKAAVKTAKTAADIISAGINHLKSTDWYKNLTDKEQATAENDLIQELSNLGKVPIPKKKLTTKQKIRQLLGGVPVLTLVDKKVFEPLANTIENLVAKKVTEGLASRSSFKRAISQGATSWYNGLPRSDRQLSQRRRVKGLQEAAFEKGLKTAKDLQTLINFDPKSTKRVHSALDPEIYKEGDQTSYEDLNDNEKALFDALREINNKTHELNYAMDLIPEETYQKYKGNYIGRGYQVYEEGADNIEKRNFLGVKLNTDIYKQRKEIDQWKIDNTITDPIYLTVNRMIQTERNAAVKAYSTFISKQPKFVSKEARPGYTKLSGNVYGDLNGKFVINFVAEDFKGYFYTNDIMDSLYDVVKLYDRIQVRQFLKKYHTVYSPIVQVGNFVSNNAFAFSSGINIVELWSNIPSARKDIKNKTGDYITILENGIIGSNVLTGDLTLSKPQQESLKLDEGKRNRAVKAIKKLDEKAQEIYQGSDDIMKLAAYKALRQTGLTEAEAVKRVFEGFQNYAVVGKIWDFASKAPIVGNAYIKFQADLQRIIKNAVTKRPLTTASFLGSLTLLAQITSALSGEKEEEKRIREERGFIPKISVGNMDISLVFKVGTKEVNLARFISPYYKYDIPQKSWLEKVTEFTPFQIIETESKALGQTSRNLDSPDVLLGSVWAAFMNDTDFRGKSIADPYATRYKESGLTEPEKMWNRFNYVFRSAVPLYSTAQDLYKSSQYGEDFYGRNKSVVDIVASKLVKMQTFHGEDYKKQALKQLKSIEYQQKKINSKIKSISQNISRKIRDTKQLQSEGKITQEQAANRIKRYNDNFKSRTSKQLLLLTEQQEKLNKIVSDFRGL